ncbi:MAG: hypothetical protein KGJ79_05880 [Alphaproteobacteria bacterium]|nr:hypothetical protein [Alphaproteobacteria bacterium]MDE2110651.1 hypothetical protein [Alphaproteobacteria bacterium]MDE2495080.1 hypothetical protein [Alphaproteobacteria bacterium]
MRTKHLLLPALVAFFAAPAAAQTDLHLDKPVLVNGIESACAGIGDSSEHDPRWNAYPLKIVLAGKDGQYLADADVSLTHGGKTAVSVHCGGPWVLFRPSPGRYRVVGGIGKTTAIATAYVKAGRQARVILRFPNVGGTASPQDTSVPHPKPISN